MKRALLLPLLLLAGVITAPPQVSADPGYERPKITVIRWKEPPVTTSSGECDEQGVCDEEILILKAHDPDSSITEVQVWFDENGDRAPFVMAHTYCVQGKKPGEVARLEIGGMFSDPGDYTVAAVAYSHKRCLAHEKGDGHPSLHSKVKRLQTTVEDPQASTGRPAASQSGNPASKTRVRNPSLSRYRAASGAKAQKEPRQ